MFCYILSIGMVVFHFVLVENGSGQDFFNLTIPKITNFLFVSPVNVGPRRAVLTAWMPA